VSTLEDRSRAGPGLSSALVVLGGPLSPAEIPLLVTRLELILRNTDRRIVDCDVSGLNDPDCVVVDALARMALLCRRTGRRLRLRGAARKLQDLLVLAGLSEILPCLPE
jgi:ABC-type transporter Mla MlaB component